MISYSSVLHAFQILFSGDFEWLCFDCCVIINIVFDWMWVFFSICVPECPIGVNCPRRPLFYVNVLCIYKFCHKRRNSK